ncbi:hypothetical protein [Vibrio sp. MEBiC08052]|uniref:hypothetical protein n=1 Tax=Vibrio sp. MEBiC08052 TaxID=1761910 RepID=UPI000740589D|nr:hypothetical protein [Vibrio sp. MEBiC08052]KUI97416.1 hypothetical protein VRK_36050 [Vibrio sp. MEBiC08052]
MGNSPAVELSHITIVITLLDDLHTGSGLGNGFVDSLQARDRNGNPVISRQHFKGVLVDTLKEYIRLVGENESTASMSALLGLVPERSESVQLLLGSFYLKDPVEESPYIEWSSSARGKGGDRLNRAPKDDTLRVVEYVKAGLQFESHAILISDKASHQTLCSDFKKFVRRIDRLGSKRNRGAGGITMEIDGPKRILPHNKKSKHHPADEQPYTLRITLENQEPLRLPSTRVPGNVIPTESYIRSATLRGALANWFKVLGFTAQFEQLLSFEGDDAIVVTDALPSVTGLQSHVWPLSLQLTKKKTEVATSILPWWFSGTSENIKDTLNDPLDEQNKESYKRNKKDDFIVHVNGQWQRVSPAKAVHMRNKVRTQFSGQEDDSELFSEEVLSEQSRFTAELTFPSRAKAAMFELTLNWAQRQSVTFGLGRGKAPCKIVDVQDVVRLPTDDIDWEKPFTVVLQSPWLLYSPETLQSHEALTNEVICQAFQVVPLGNTFEIRSDPMHISGFNFATGLPRKSVAVIAPGSVFRVKNPSAELVAAIQSGQAVGERTVEGFGRYWCYQDLTLTASEIPSEKQYPNNIQETLSAKVKKMVSDDFKVSSRHQWQHIKNQLLLIQQQKHPIGKEKHELEKLLKVQLNPTTQGGREFLNSDKTKDLLEDWKHAINVDNVVIKYPLHFSLLLVDHVIAGLGKSQEPQS